MFPLLMLLGGALVAVGAVMKDPFEKTVDKDKKPDTQSVLQPENSVPTIDPPPPTE